MAGTSAARCRRHSLGAGAARVQRRHGRLGLAGEGAAGASRAFAAPPEARSAWRAASAPEAAAAGGRTTTAGPEGGESGEKARHRSARGTRRRGSAPPPARAPRSVPRVRRRSGRPSRRARLASARSWSPVPPTAASPSRFPPTRPARPTRRGSRRQSRSARAEWSGSKRLRLTNASATRADERLANRRETEAVAGHHRHPVERGLGLDDRERRAPAEELKDQRRGPRADRRRASTSAESTSPATGMPSASAIPEELADRALPHEPGHGEDGLLGSRSRPAPRGRRGGRGRDRRSKGPRERGGREGGCRAAPRNGRERTAAPRLARGHRLAPHEDLPVANESEPGNLGEDPRRPRPRRGARRRRCRCRRCASRFPLTIPACAGSACAST